MAPGDLNLKKSWNPKLMKNRKKVWEREQEALEERKKIKQRQEEIKKEREKQELRNLVIGKTGKKTSLTTDRIDWMYEPSKNSNKDSTGDAKQDDDNDEDDYLLGKKRLDELLTKKSTNQNSTNVSRTNRNIDKLNSILATNEQKKNSKLLTQKELIKISSEDPLMKFKQIKKNRKNISHRQ